MVTHSQQLSSLPQELHATLVTSVPHVTLDFLPPLPDLLGPMAHYRHCTDFSIYSYNKASLLRISDPVGDPVVPNPC